MAIKYTPEVDRPGAQPLETKPRRSGGWFRRLQQRVKLALAANDEELIVENRTEVRWFVYQNFHKLGIIDAGELLVFHIHKHGSLSARPVAEGDEVEYLVLPLNYDVTYVHIYCRQIGKDVEVYDMRAAGKAMQPSVKGKGHDE
jgi:hypothetical protein